MSQRVTSKELTLLKLAASTARMTAKTPEQVSSAQMIMTLADEVIRLRSLVRDAANLFAGGPGLCIVCGATLPQHHEACPGLKLLEESRSFEAGES